MAGILSISRTRILAPEEASPQACKKCGAQLGILADHSKPWVWSVACSKCDYEELLFEFSADARQTSATHQIKKILSKPGPQIQSCLKYALDGHGKEGPARGC